jgi:RimJ/RimL family protein N-acetyltransferase
VTVLTGERLTLRPPRAGDDVLRQRHGWHREIERCYGHASATRAMTDDEAAEWLADVLPRELFWVVEVDRELVGIAFLHSRSDADRRARYAVGLFAPEHLGHGYGTEITRLVLDHAFGELALHRVDLRVLAFNTAAIACYEKAGFVVEGRERESCRLDGNWYDDLVMGLLAREHRART